MHVRQFIRSKKVITQATGWRCGATNPKEKMGKDACVIAELAAAGELDPIEGGSAIDKLLGRMEVKKKDKPE